MQDARAQQEAEDLALARALQDEESGHVEMASPAVACAEVPADSARVVQATSLANPVSHAAVVVVDVPSHAGGLERPEAVLAFQLSRGVRFFSLVHVLLCLLWSLRFFVLVLFVPLAMCGFVGAKRFRSDILIGYVVFLVLGVISRVLMFLAASTVLGLVLALVGLLVELYVLRLTVRLRLVIHMLNDNDLAVLRSGFVPSARYVWW